MLVSKPAGIQNGYFMTTTPDDYRYANLLGAMLDPVQWSSRHLAQYQMFICLSPQSINKQTISKSDWQTASFNNTQLWGG
jgi:hypothetical protein